MTEIVSEELHGFLCDLKDEIGVEGEGREHGGTGVDCHRDS